ncbi:glycoside hydrolase family 108 protein [Microvirga antarctica]|uniref:glycoside hydrolase family 108 protein n=1 Tax=Microvirga antarctica TaxID=2819233 RepID=UPI001B305017|nr:glycoside hydrolase family 108 protein [Microvirga antarctica]
MATDKANTFTSDTFTHSVSVVLAQEGGFVMHPADPGGATNFGITRATLAEARRRAVSVEDVKALTREEAAAIYRRRYWDTIRASDMPAGLSLALFDFAVHAGPGRAVRVLQALVGEAGDGVVGPDTLSALRHMPAADLIRRLTRARLAFLARLSTWPVFGKGWRKRALAVEREALRLAADSPQP